MCRTHLAFLPFAPAFVTLTLGPSILLIQAFLRRKGLCVLVTCLHGIRARSDEQTRPQRYCKGRQVGQLAVAGLLYAKNGKHLPQQVQHLSAEQLHQQQCQQDDQCQAVLNCIGL